MEEKHLSLGKKLLVMLLFSISIVFEGIFLGFFIKYLYLGILNNDRDSIDMSLMGLVSSFIIGLIFSITLIIILRDYDKNKKEKNIKWYIDKFLFSLIPVLITLAVVLFSFYTDENEIMYLSFSVLLFLFIGIITTPNVIIYALNDMKDWKNIIYKNGNLGYVKKAKGFYKMHAPVAFERKLYFAVLKVQLLDIFAVLLVIFFVIISLLFFNSVNSSEINGNILYAFAHVKSVRADGYMFFISIFLAAFWIPIFAYYITNAVYKLRIVKRHQYIVYHAIVDKVDTFKIRINSGGVNYKYDYCSCVGIKAKNIDKTNAILVFVPDELILFPEDYS